MSNSTETMVKYYDAISNKDLQTICECFDIPSKLISLYGVVNITSRDDIIKTYSDIIETWKTQNISNKIGYDKNTFDVSDPNKNLIAQDDDGYNGGNGYQFELTQNLESETTYWAVISTYDSEEEMSGDVNVFGPTGSSINITTIPEPTAIALILIGSSTLLIGKRIFKIQNM